MVLLTQKTSKFKTFLGRSAIVVACIILGLILVRNNLIRANVIGNSMMPFFQDGAVLLMQKRILSPDIGDVYGIEGVKLSYHPQWGEKLIKRVVAGPGDTLTFNVESGEMITFNGQSVSYPIRRDAKAYLLQSEEDNSFGEVVRILPARNTVLNIDVLRVEPDQDVSDPKRKLFVDRIRDYPFLLSQAKGKALVTMTVPDEHYFVLSDNMSSNLDSRYFGFVPESALTHRLLKQKS